MTRCSTRQPAPAAGIFDRYDLTLRFAQARSQDAGARGSRPRGPVAFASESGRAIGASSTVGATSAEVVEQALRQRRLRGSTLDRLLLRAPGLRHRKRVAVVKSLQPSPPFVLALLPARPFPARQPKAGTPVR